MIGRVSLYLTCFLLFATIHRIFSATKCDEFQNKLPAFDGSPCDTECEKPYVCVTREPRQWMSPFDDSSHVCRCLPPYKNDEYSNKCYRDIKCEPDEVMVDYECIKRCESDAYRSNGKCLQFALLGQSCVERDQCKAAFADCQDGKCTCVNGFSAIDENTCQTQNFTCPFGEPLYLSPGVLLECGDEKAYLKTKGECPLGYTCLVSGAAYMSLKKIPRGHCCPAWSRKCPVGEPHPNATCYWNRQSEPGQTHCPEKTHHCHDIRGPWKTTEALCCPRACPQDKQFVNGSCIRLKSLDDPCQWDEECEGGYGEKLACKQGRCACADGYAPVFDKYQRTTKCSVQCGEGEHKELYPDTCIKSKKLGEPCNPEDSFMTGCRSSICSPETKTCACECNEIPLDEYSCITKPECPRVPRRQTNFTFCRIKGGNDTMTMMNSSLAQKCPVDSYCAKYQYRTHVAFTKTLPTVGVCCPKTDPLCPDGTKGTTKCDPSETNSCGKDMKCHQHTEDISVDADPTESHVCCNGLQGQLLRLLN